MSDDGRIIDRKVQGGIRFGSANIGAFDRAQGYVVHLYTMDTSQSITDLKLKRKHIQEIYDLILAWFPEVQSSDTTAKEEPQ